MKKKLLNFFKVFFVVVVVLFGLLYLFQEKMIFFPQKLAKDYKFNFNGNFEELNITTRDSVVLNGLLFKSKKPKGLIFYLHGNGGSLAGWGSVANAYTDLNYDVFIIDYRGYGKSGGEINGQEQVFSDIQMVYNKLLEKYDESNIIVLGYSIGSGIAAKIASVNNPKALILQAPYYSLVDLMKHYYPVIPTFILKYKFETNKYVEQCNMPIYIFHGLQDNVIYYASSVKLKERIKPTDTLITLQEQGHNGISDNPEYLMELSKILAK